MCELISEIGEHVVVEMNNEYATEEQKAKAKIKANMCQHLLNVLLEEGE
jgi:hypothetical protein